jgi:uncharacterized membrane protein
MNEPSSSDIIRVAQERLAARQAQEQAQREAQPATERIWRFAFAGLIAAMLLGLLAWPGIPLNWKMYAAVHGVCAQIHNVEMGGLQLPLCARNTGIYASYLITTIYLFVLGRNRAGKLPPLPITITLGLLVVIMGVDGINSMLRDLFLPNLYVPRNEIRTLTGIGMGMAVSVMLLLILNLALRKDIDREQRILNGWRELGGALLINLLAWAAIYGNIALFYWPIAIVAWVGIIGILFCVNLLIAAIALRYENMIVRWIDLARPATIAVILTMIELGLLAWVRFWMEGQGLVIS